jgi:hypothetical protein
MRFGAVWAEGRGRTPAAALGAVLALCPDEPPWDALPDEPPVPAE